MIRNIQLVFIFSFLFLGCGKIDYHHKFSKRKYLNYFHVNKNKDKISQKKAEFKVQEPIFISSLNNDIFIDDQSIANVNSAFNSRYDDLIYHDTIITKSNDTIFCKISSLNNAYLHYKYLYKNQYEKEGLIKLKDIKLYNLKNKEDFLYLVLTKNRKKYIIEQNEKVQVYLKDKKNIIGQIKIIDSNYISVHDKKYKIDSIQSIFTFKNSGQQALMYIGGGIMTATGISSMAAARNADALAAGPIALFGFLLTLLGLPLVILGFISFKKKFFLKDWSVKVDTIENKLIHRRTGGGGCLNFFLFFVLFVILLFILL